MNENNTACDAPLAPPAPTAPQSEGEYLVGVNFNPGGHSSVNAIKRMAAALIDMIRAVGVDGRCTALAVTAIEEGAMWGVKSATKPARDTEAAPTPYAPAPQALPE